MSADAPQAAPKPQLVALAAISFLHVAMMFAGFTILADSFNFPDILRDPAVVRLALFAADQTLIQGTYWMLAMTGITQILFTVLFVQSFPQNRSPGLSTLLMLTLIFGVLTGFGQAMGFGRWAILIPYLADQLLNGGADAATIALLEGAFNRYAGMLVGEHLSNIAWGIFFISAALAVLVSTTFDRRIAIIGIIGTPLFFVLAAEQLGLDGPILPLITDFGFPVLAIWHFAIAWSALRFDRAEWTGPRLGAGFWVMMAIVYGAMIWPAIAG